MKKENTKIKKTAQAPLEVSGSKKKHRENKPLTGQERQDEIFRKMSADRRIKLGAQLWQLAKILAGNKIYYEAKRSKASFGRDR